MIINLNILITKRRIFSRKETLIRLIDDFRDNSFKNIGQCLELSLLLIVATFG